MTHTHTRAQHTNTHTKAMPVLQLQRQNIIVEEIALAKVLEG